MAQKFFICRKCGNLVGLIDDAGVTMKCCNELMEELQANSVDASQEKHVPVANWEGDCLVVKVGEAAHPMLEEHYIEFIYVETEKGGQRKRLKPGDAPEAKFCFVDDKPLNVFAYCNLHGLWVKEL